MDDGTLWLAVSTTVAKLLQDYAIGTSEGGPHTATETSCNLLALLPDPATSDQVCFASDDLQPSEAEALEDLHLAAARFGFSTPEFRGGHIFGSGSGQCTLRHNQLWSLFY